MEKHDLTNADFSQNYILNGLAAMPGGFFIYRGDESEEILYANQTLLNMFECENEEQFMSLTGGCFPGIVYPDDLPEVQRSIDEQVSEDDNHFDQVTYRIKTRTGQLRMVEDYGRLYVDPVEGPLYYVFISPEMIKHDSLTGLLNMSYFMTTAYEEERRMYRDGKIPVTMNFNLSGMKRFNSKYGRDEGNKLLIAFSDILKCRFGTGRCSRFGEDHFYAYTDLNDVENQLNGLIVDLHEANEGRTLPVKIGIVNYDPEATMTALCDRAKIACDAKDASYGSGFKWFDESMAKTYDMQQHILEHLDEAMANNWIQVYYQPVVRTMTGRLSSMEALARWDDPKRGMISPGVFIPLLEEKGLSHKVDLYIARRVAEILQRRMKSGQAIAPTSINISRADFEMCDPAEEIARIADEYGIRRNLFAIEITETALVNDDGMIKKAIERFHDAGFEVWMDDFGSGYSSLNVLKDYDFDKLKIDMVFLKDFSVRSKNIITATVQMAKKLGIHTVAEGVETEEQLAFLRSVGCEKIQGFYYGKPLPAEEAIHNLTVKDMSIETREIASFYDKVGMVDLLSDHPLALFLYDGYCFKMAFENASYSDVIRLPGYTDQEVIEMDMNQADSSLHERFHQLAEKAKASKKTERMTFVAREGYYHFTFRLIANCRLGCMLMATIEESEINENVYASNLDMVVRNLVSTYDAIYLVDLEQDTRTTILSNLPEEDAGEVVHGIHDFYAHYQSVRQPHPEDIERLKKFQSLPYLSEKMEEAERGTFRDMFRLKQPDGNFQWTEFQIIVLPESKRKAFLVCVSPSEIEFQKDKDYIIKGILEGQEGSEPVATVDRSNRMTDADFLYSLVIDSEIKLFWKDTKRRFLGASNAFLAYYGFSSVQEILGKTDEEIGWHMEDAGFRADEETVLKKGKVIKRSQGSNVIGGSAKRISATKFPIYHNGKIVGLMGYFFDISEDTSTDVKLMREGLKDEITGFLNIQGFMASILDYDEAYRTGKQDYTYIHIGVMNYESFYADFGQDVAYHLIQTVAEHLGEVFDLGAMIGRANGCNFVISVKGQSDDEISEKIETLSQILRRIRDVDGCPCRIRILYGIAKGSEGSNVQEVVELARTRFAITENGENELHITDVKKARIEPDLYTDIPLAYVMCQPKVDENNEVVDMEFLYVNQKYCEMTGKHRQDLIGHGYMESFPYTSKKWVEFGLRASKGEFVHSRAYGGDMGQWMDFVMAPSSKPGIFAAIFNVDRDKVMREHLESSHNTDEVIIQIGRILSSIKNRDIAIQRALERLGEVLKADCIAVVEADTGDWNVSYEWHSLKQEGQTFSLDQMKRDVPLCIHDQELIGYLEVDHYDSDTKLEVHRLLEISSFFIAARLQVPEM